MQFNLAIILAVVAMSSSAVLSAPAGVENRALETVDAHIEAAVENYARDPIASPVFERDVETIDVPEESDVDEDEESLEDPQDKRQNKQQWKRQNKQQWKRQNKQQWKRQNKQQWKRQNKQQWKRED